MTLRSFPRLLLAACTSGVLVLTTAWSVQAQPTLALSKARVTLAGTSNIHDYTATTSTVRLTRVQLAAAGTGTDFWAAAVKPGVLQAFEVAIPATSLKSSKGGLDKNMYKALDTKEHADITFKLTRLEPRTGAAGVQARGLLQVAGVEREVVIPLDTAVKGDALVVTGEVGLLMTDFGIAPPRAMLGALRTAPAVTITFEVQLASTQT